LLTTRPGQAADAPTPLDDAMRSIRPAFVHLVLFSAFINVSGFAGYFFGIQVLDRVMTTLSYGTLAGLGVFFLIALVLGTMLRAYRASILRRLGIAFNDQISHRIYDASYYGSLQTRRLDSLRLLNDLDTVRDFSTGPGIAALLDFPFMPLYVAAAFIIHVWLGLILLVAVAVICLILFVGDLTSRERYKQAAESSARAERIRESAFREAETLQAMAMKRGFRERWLESYRRGEAMRVSTASYMETIHALLDFLHKFVGFGLVAITALLVIRQQATPGAMMGIMLIGNGCIGIGQSAVSRWLSFVAARQAYGRLQTVFRSLEAERKRLSLPAPRGELSVRDLAMAAPHSKRFIIAQVSFSLPAGSALGVIGPSGAGKSTLVRALVGIWTPSHGSVRLDGAELQHWDPDELGRHLGYLPQNVELLSGTIAENIARFGEVDDAAVLEAARLAGVHDVIQQLSQGYNTQVGEGGGSLSGGQRQRIGLARALYGNPALVVLDEPNSNLDALGETALADALRAMRERGTTCILITHKANILKMVDHVLVLKDGTMSAFGPRDQVLSPVGLPSIPPPPDRAALPTPDHKPGDAA